MKITRRNFLEALGLVGIISLFTPGELVHAFGPVYAPLRPPGAITEEEFNVKCIRCFKCGQVCPTGAISFGKWTEGQLADTPVLNNLNTNACNLCMECTKECPTQALIPIEPNLESIRQNVKIGVAHISEENCVIYNGKRRICHFCLRVCPLRGAAIYVNAWRQPVIDNYNCLGCGLCGQACPAAAIEVQGV